MGVLLCLLSAAAFGSMAIFGKLAYDDGVGVLTLLAVRFAMASLLLVPLSAATGRLRAAGPRVARTGFLLGALGYATQAGLFFAALERMDASLLSLLLYTYPAMVVAAALLLGRERRDGRRLAALGVASSGVALVLAGAGTGAFDAAGAAMALGAAAAYTTYILVADARAHGADPLALTAWVAVGAATSFTVLATATGRLDVGFAARGWLWLGLISLVCTVVAVLAFFGGLQRVGPSAASILSTFEPPVTVALAFAAFGERLSGVQLLGGALVLAAVVVLQVRPRGVPARADAAAPAAA
jgi:drug/metabolite transporter (DMT)-like permease